MKMQIFGKVKLIFRLLTKVLIDLLIERVDGEFFWVHYVMLLLITLGNVDRG